MNGAMIAKGSPVKISASTQAAATDNCVSRGSDKGRTAPDRREYHQAAGAATEAIGFWEGTKLELARCLARGDGECTPRRPPQRACRPSSPTCGQGILPSSQSREPPRLRRASADLPPPGPPAFLCAIADAIGTRRIISTKHNPPKRGAKPLPLFQWYRPKYSVCSASVRHCSASSANVRRTS
jgi:hypothetical protein